MQKEITGEKIKLKKSVLTTRQLVAVALLSTIAFILQNFEMPIAIFPGFLQIELSDIPAVIGAVMLGPVSGVFVEAVKNILHLTRTTTGGVGELANFIVGVALVVPMGYFCKNEKTMKKFVIGSIAGIIVMAISAAIMNAFVLLPFYAKLFNSDVMSFVAMSTAVFPFIDTYLEFILFTIIPFNVLKGVIVALTSGLMYKYLRVNTFFK